MDKGAMLELAAGATVRPYGEGYLATDQGEVISPLRGGCKLRPTCNPDGYKMVSIRENGRFRQRKVATIICEAFHGPRPFPTALVRHLDGSRDNDAPYNLAWGTASENSKDMVRHGTHPGRRNGLAGARYGEDHPRSRLTWEKVREIRARRNQGEMLNALADEFGVCFSSISHICVGATWREPGMIITKGIRYG